MTVPNNIWLFAFCCRVEQKQDTEKRHIHLNAKKYNNVSCSSVGNYLTIMFI